MLFDRAPFPVGPAGAVALNIPIRLRNPPQQAGAFGVEQARDDDETVAVVGGQFDIERDHFVVPVHDRQRFAACGLAVRMTQPSR